MVVLSERLQGRVDVEAVPMLIQRRFLPRDLHLVDAIPRGDKECLHIRPPECTIGHQVLRYRNRPQRCTRLREHVYARLKLVVHLVFEGEGCCAGDVPAGRHVDPSSPIEADAIASPAHPEIV